MVEFCWKKQIALSQGLHKGAWQLKIFSSQEIEKATDSFDPDLILGFSAHSTIYKARIEGRLVAIETALELEPKSELVDLSLTAASTAMVMNHDNMVKLYGCCLETVVPIIVYEFVSYGSLFECLHGDIACSKRIKWADCLRIAIDTAYALSYMHNALSKPVVHRDVNSKSILLDNSFHGTLSNFGYSVSITPGKPPQRWPVKGTPGYIDPEHMETQEVTDKCDVYSVGVVMLELLTRRQPLLMARDGTDLVDLFVSAVRKNCMMEMIDNEVVQQASRDEIQQVAELALACVAKKGAERPTMIDVVGELWSIQGRDMKWNRNCV
uniref:Protein kinase domain-containing protein n=1 Tax=Chenopodium quinoa TaxID=63459 RepID=A0A803L4A6_CHEQI